MRTTMMDYPLTLVHLLERARRYFPKTEIVSRLPDRSLHRYTYGDFYRRSRALAAALTRAGMRKGDRVATLMWNHYAHLEAYFGIPVAGGVVHTLNLRLHPDDIAYIANDAEDRFLIVDDCLLPLLEQFKDRIRLERVFVVPLTGKPVPAGYENYEDLLKTGDGPFDYPELNENDAGAMCYTSGTTGRPPGVVYSHRSMVLHSLSITVPDSLGLSQHEVMMPVVPMFHVLSWGTAHACVMVGAKLVMPGPHLDPQSLVDLCEREQVTVAAGVPTVWLGILQLLERKEREYRLAPGLRLPVGGSAAPEAMIRGFDKFSITVIHAWGMTETSPVATVSKLKPHLRNLPEDERYAIRARTGYALPLVDLRVIGDDDREIPADGKAMGEIQVRGPFVTASYHNKERDPGKFTPDGWLRTGDVATIDAEGYIKICDRTKDLIKSGGEWISSVDLEGAIMGHPAVAEAAVVAAPHPKWGERPVAFVVLKPGAAASAEEIASFIEPKFAKWWLPDNYVFVDAIPRTSTGKFLKRELREKVALRKRAEAG
ncbi:MAG: long-chain fatty acid--CoA ligase [Terriglobales bacterium]